MAEDLYAEVGEVKEGILKVRFTGAAGTNENFGKYLREVTDRYQGAGSIAVLFDATAASLPHYRYIKMQADWLESHEEMMKSQCAGTAYVIPNGMVRGILNMIFTLQKQPVPYEVFSNKAEAEPWLQERLREK